MATIVFDEECQSLLNADASRLMPTNRFPLTYAFNGMTFSQPRRYHAFSYISKPTPQYANASTFTVFPSSTSSFTQCPVPCTLGASRSVSCQSDSLFSALVESKQVQTCFASASTTRGIQTVFPYITPSARFHASAKTLLSEGVQATPLPTITISTSIGTDEMASDLQRVALEEQVHELVLSVLNDAMAEIHADHNAASPEENLTLEESAFPPAEVDDTQEKVLDHLSFKPVEEDGFELISPDEANLPCAE